MKKLHWTFFCLVILFSLNCFAQNTIKPKASTIHLDKIVAIVNNEAIAQSNLDKEMEQARKQMEHYNQPIPGPSEFRKQVLDSLIDKTLQLQLARSKGVSVSDEDTTKAIESIAKNNKISVSQLKDAIVQTGIKYEEYTAQIHEQLLLQKLQQQELAKNISLTPEDVKKFTQENKSKFNQYSAFHVLDVLIPITENSTSSQQAEAKKQAIELVKQLQTSKEVDTIVNQFSNAELNDLGWRSLGEIPSIFQAKVSSMSVNTVSSPLQAPNGFHILKLVEVKGQSIKPTENQLKNMVFQQKMIEEVKIWNKKLRNDAYIKIMN